MPTHSIRKTLVYIAIIFLFVVKATFVKAQQQVTQTEKKLSPNEMPSKIFGLTIDESSLDEVALKMDAPKLIENILTELRKIKAAQPNSKALTVRIVLPIGCESGGDCDPSETKLTNKLDKKYLDLLQRIKNEGLAFVMAELVDSDTESSTKCFTALDETKSVAAYLERTKKMYEKLGKYVDIWEIGNEVNGDWFGGTVVGNVKNEQRRKIVVGQLKAAYDFLNAKKIEIENSNKLLSKDDKFPRTAITFYFNGDGKKRNSYENINDAMLRWIRGIGNHFMDKNNKKISFTNLDYLLVSYYPDDNFYEPNGDVSDYSIQINLTPKDWVEIFDTIRTNYSSTTKFGLGEMGTQCYFPKKPLTNNVQNDCKTLRIDLLKNGRNPCDTYDAKGEMQDTRKCPCCLQAQVKVTKEYYTDLDKQITDEMKVNISFKNADRFIGGYFNWYYSVDVINKMANGTVADKLQAEKVRNAIIEAYKGFGR
jgi:hypothetical protein